MAKNGRVKNKDRVLKAWKSASWPPALGAKVRLFAPKDFRGKVAKVIAVGDEKAKNSTRRAPKGKIRIMCESYQFSVSKEQVFPADVTLKQLQG